jgi:hypothetical protein
VPRGGGALSHVHTELGMTPYAHFEGLTIMGQCRPRLFLGEYLTDGAGFAVWGLDMGQDKRIMSLGVPHHESPLEEGRMLS